MEHGEDPEYADDYYNDTMLGLFQRPPIFIFILLFSEFSLPVVVVLVGLLVASSPPWIIPTMMPLLMRLLLLAFIQNTVPRLREEGNL